MSRPVDSYPITTQDGRQIRLDAVSIKYLDSLDYTPTAGSVPTNSMLEADGVYVLVATTDCIVDFIATATKALLNSPAVLLLSGERATIMLPEGATGFSAIGLSVAGTLYIQRLNTWAGLADAITLGNQ